MPNILEKCPNLWDHSIGPQVSSHWVIYTVVAYINKQGGTHSQNKVYQFRVLHFSLNTATQVFTCLRHRVAAYLHHQGIWVIPYLDDWLIHQPDRQVSLHHRSQLLNILNMVGLRLNEAKSELEPVQDIQFLGFHYSWIRGELPSQYPKLGRYDTRMPNILEKCPNLWDHSIGPQVSSHWVIYTVVAYINKQGGSHSHLLLRL